MNNNQADFNPESGAATSAEDLSAKNNQHTSGHSKILLLYASSGAGHKVACRAIEQALLAGGFTCKIKTIDILDHVPRPVAKLYSKGYLFAATRLPWLWYALYESGSHLSQFKSASPWHDNLMKLILWRVNRILQQEAPDYIISAYFTSSWAAARYKAAYAPDCRVATVVTDYGLHPAWLIPGQDRYFVATEENRIELAQFEWYTRVGNDRINVAGIPVEKRFAVPRDKDLLKKQHGLSDDRFTVLLLAGDYDRFYIESILGQLILANSPIQILIVSRSTFSLSDELQSELQKKNIFCRMFGKIDFLDDLMAIADVAISKTGGLTSSECFSSGCPLLIYRPYPGQEERNAALFLEKGAAWRLFQLGSLSYKIDKLASDSKLHRTMVEAARAIINPNAADDIARIVIDDLNSKRNS